VGTIDERRLRARLARVEALYRRAGTPGEKAAAAEARERLERHLDRLRAEDPVATFVRDHLAELGVPGAPPPPPGRVPDADELLAWLDAWERGGRSAREVASWAAEVVDRVELPADPASVGAIVGEVLLQLSSQAVPHPGLIDAARRFLRTGDWSDWFALVARLSPR
jgi:hypothetical protein